MYKFKIDSYEFVLHHLLIEECTLLHSFITFEERKETKGIVLEKREETEDITEVTLEDIDPGNFENFTLYLRGGDFLWNQEISDFFDYMGYPNNQGYPLDYWKVKLRDRWIRNNFYRLELWKEESKKRFNLEIETGPYVGLERAEHLFSFIDFQNSIEIMEDLNDFYSFDGFILAGGALITLLMDSPRIPADFDFFVVTQDEKRGNEILKEMIINKSDFISSWFLMGQRSSASRKIRRTRHAITFIRPIKEQVILRLYTCPSEVVHGFDLDSCGILYDGEGLWATQRTIYSISRKVNFFDPERMSETYAYRLARYISRGFRVWLPGFKKELVEMNKIGKLINEKKSSEVNAPWGVPAYLVFSKLGEKVLNHPLDMIIFAQYYRYMPKLHRSDYDIKNHPGEFHWEDVEVDLSRCYKEKFMKFYEIDEIDEKGKCNISYWIYSGSGYVTILNLDHDETDDYFELVMEYFLDSLLELDPVRVENSGLPQKLEWKTQNPMEQLSGTFNPTKTTINDWYKDSYLYDNPNIME